MNKITAVYSLPYRLYDGEEWRETTHEANFGHVAFNVKLGADKFDRYGRRIYEGDYVNYEGNGKRPRVCRVDYAGSGGVFTLLDTATKGFVDFLRDAPKDGLVVIGASKREEYKAVKEEAEAAAEREAAGDSVQEAMEVLRKTVNEMKEELAAATRFHRNLRNRVELIELENWRKGGGRVRRRR